MARVGQGDGDGTGVEIEDSTGIKRVAVLAHDELLVNGRQLAVMSELPEAVIFDDVAEIEIGLGADEVVRGHGNRTIGARDWRGRNAKPQAEREFCKFGFHNSVFPRRSFAYFILSTSGSAHVLSKCAFSGP